MDENHKDEFSRFPVNDQEFLANRTQEIGEQKSFADIIERLHKEELGKAIAIIYRASSNLDPITKEIIGYILPTNLDNSQHLIIMKDGTMAVVGPKYPENAKSYRDLMYPSETTINFHAEDQHQRNIRAITNQYPLSNIDVIAVNDRPENLSQIEEAADKALGIANQLKTQRLEAQKRSITTVQDKFNKFFNPPTDNPDPTAG